MLRGWIPLGVLRFSTRRLLVLTTAFAVVFAVSPQTHANPWVRGAITVYLLLLVGWCIIVSYSVLLRIRQRREEIHTLLQQEYQRAKQGHLPRD